MGWGKGVPSSEISNLNSFKSPFLLPKTIRIILAFALPKPKKKKKEKKSIITVVKDVNINQIPPISRPMDVIARATIGFFQSQKVILVAKTMDNYSHKIFTMSEVYVYILCVRF